MEGPLPQANDKSTLIDVLLWFFLVCGILGVMAQTVTKIVVRRSLGPEDYLIHLSLAFAIAQSVCVSIQISRGLGKTFSAVDPTQLDVILKAEYAGRILFMVCLCLTKLSPIVFIRSLARVKSFKYAVHGLVILTIAWTLSSISVSVFQCHLPEPWNYLNNACIDRRIFWTYYGVMNIITDLGPVILIIILASRIRTSRRRKYTVAGVFTSRLIVVAAICCQLYFINKAIPTTNHTLDMWPVWICTQLVQALAIITACIPYLKPFMDSLESGGWRVNGLPRARASGFGSSHSAECSSKSATGILGGSQSTTPRIYGSHHDRDEHNGLQSSYDLGTMGTACCKQIGNGVRVEVGAGSDWEDGESSQLSQSRIIKETRTFAVNVETRI